MASNSKHLYFAIDSSGVPGDTSTFSVGVVVCGQDDFDHACSSLQLIRDLYCCNSSIHYCELSGFDGKAKTAESWVKVALRSPKLSVYGNILVVPPTGFDLSRYGGNPDRAINRTVVSGIKRAVNKRVERSDFLNASLLLDGDESGEVGTVGIRDYLVREIPSHLAGLCDGCQVDAEMIPKRPLAERDSKERTKQDLVALCDVLTSSARACVANDGAHGAEPEGRAKLMSAISESDRLAENGFRAEDDQIIEVTVYRFPGPTFTDIQKYLQGSSN